MIERASLISPARTLWITERSATIAPTPIATQTKKNSSRRQRRTELARRASAGRMSRGRLCRRRASSSRTTRPSRSATTTSATAASSGSCVTSTSVVLPRAVDVEQQLESPTARWRCRDCRWARRRAGWAGCWRAPARWRRAAARRPTAATDSDGRDRTARLPRAAPSPAAAAFGTPAISIGTSTFSKAVSDGSR